MATTERILVLYLNPWKLTDDKTGEVKSGVSLHFVNPNMDSGQQENGAAGLQPGKQSISPVIGAKLKDKQLPCWVTAEKKSRIKSLGQGRTIEENYISNVAYHSPFNLGEMIPKQ